MKKFQSILFTIALLVFCSIANFAQDLNPKVLKYFAPKYSPAARAVRATGSVDVLISIDKNGKVISTIVKSGHPLLRATSEIAAKEWTFKQNDLNKKEITITFVYIIKENKEAKKNYKATTYKTKFKKPYRSEITATEYLRVNY